MPVELQNRTHRADQRDWPTRHQLIRRPQGASRTFHTAIHMYTNLNMDIDIETSSAALGVSCLLSSLANVNASSNADSNGSNGSNAGAESEDSFIDNSRRPIVPRQKINARERYRTFKWVQKSDMIRQSIQSVSGCSVNAAYEALRGLIPTEPVNRKLSKIEIIRLASSYITHLRSTLHTGKWKCFSQLKFIICNIFPASGTDQQPCLLHKWENTRQAEAIGITERVNICTFCLKPKVSH